MLSITLITFIGATLLVAVLTSSFVRNMERSEHPTEEYFTGGRALSWPIVAGSLLLTNLSTEQLVGLNGAVFMDGNLVGIAWEALAAFAMIATALLFLPRYLASGFTTTPAFLERRFDRSTRKLVSALFLFGYVTVLLPVVLYTGSLAIKSMFELDLPLWWVVVGIGGLGSWYAIFGGLKSVAVSDTINGVGLLVGGLAIPYLALSTLGEGSVFEGISTLVVESPETLRPIASLNKSGGPASVPWDTLLTGMMFIQIFYWSTNQVIVQRAMGAKSLAEGQKGVLFASLMKLVGPLMLCLPGIIALRMLGELSVSIDAEALSRSLELARTGANQSLASVIALGQDILESGASRISLETAEQLKGIGLSFNDQLYSALVRRVLPEWSLGLFAAVLVGSILSSFNSALNSASTLFCLEFYEERLEGRSFSSDTEKAHHLVSVGKRFGMILAVASMALAPQLAQLESIFAYLQKINGLYSVPIISIFLVGLLSERAPASSAKAAMIVGLLSYGYLTFFPVEGLHWLHAYFICLMLAVLTLLTGAKLKPKSDEEVAYSSERPPAPVDLTPWIHAKLASWVIVGLTVVMYVGLHSL